jgi:hypothetical protein
MKGFIAFFTNYYLDNQIKDDEVDGAYCRVWEI